jgi:hypothetical protein
MIFGMRNEANIITMLMPPLLMIGISTYRVPIVVSDYYLFIIAVHKTIYIFL